MSSPYKSTFSAGLGGTLFCLILLAGLIAMIVGAVEDGGFKPGGKTSTYTFTTVFAGGSLAVLLWFLCVNASRCCRDSGSDYRGFNGPRERYIDDETEELNFDNIMHDLPTAREVAMEAGIPLDHLGPDVPSDGGESSVRMSSRGSSRVSSFLDNLHARQEVREAQRLEEDSPGNGAKFNLNG